MHPYYINNYRYCPKCGYEFTDDDILESKISCPQCGFEIYEHATPAVGVIIVKNNQVLLGKRGIEPKKNTWDSVGGFVEVNETLEEACIRETLEETGLTVKIKDYISTHPDEYEGKPTFTAGFVAEIVSGKATPQDDVAELKWFNHDEIPLEEIGFPSVQKIIKNYLKKHD